MCCLSKQSWGQDPTHCCGKRRALASLANEFLIGGWYPVQPFIRCQRKDKEEFRSLYYFQNHFAAREPFPALLKDLWLHKSVPDSSKGPAQHEEHELAKLTAGWRVPCSSHHLFLRTPGCPAYRSTQPPPAGRSSQIHHSDTSNEPQVNWILNYNRISSTTALLWCFCWWGIDLQSPRHHYIGRLFVR